jgi:hypothetical protein
MTGGHLEEIDTGIGRLGDLEAVILPGAGWMTQQPRSGAWHTGSAGCDRDYHPNGRRRDGSYPGDSDHRMRHSQMAL